MKLHLLDKLGSHMRQDGGIWLDIDMDGCICKEESFINLRLSFTVGELFSSIFMNYWRVKKEYIQHYPNKAYNCEIMKSTSAYFNGFEVRARKYFLKKKTFPLNALVPILSKNVGSFVHYDQLWPTIGVLDMQAYDQLVIYLWMVFFFSTLPRSEYSIIPALGICLPSVDQK